METLTRLVAESLARHGFDRPLDYRRLQWSRWFRCESHHSLLTVPSKPGVFAIAEEIISSDTTASRVGTDSLVRPASPSEAKASTPDPKLSLAIGADARITVEERRFSAASDTLRNAALAAVSAESRKPEAESRRMLAVSQFFEDDDMAFVLDRMLSHENPMRGRMASGRYFVRYVVIEDATQRRSICNALNQWIVSSAEKATGIGSHFASSLENTYVATAVSAVPQSRSEARGSGAGKEISNPAQPDERRVNSAPTLNSAIATNIHCSSSFPSGF
jgi:hypothetical protein